MTRKRLFLAGMGLFVALIGYRLFEELGSSEAAAAARPGGARAQLVDASSPELSTLRERVALVGSLRAKRQVEVTPKFSGRVIDILVDRGDRVRAGQVLARMEDDELKQQVRRAEAQLELAHASLAQREAELDNVRAELTRTRNLAADGVVSSQQLQQSETTERVSIAQSNVARASVSQAEAELQELRIRLSQTEVVSPSNGVVGQRYLDPGAVVSTTTPIVLILEMSTMVIVVNVPEREFNKIEVGNVAAVLVDAFAGQKFEGHVARISPLLDAQTRTAPVEIELDNPELRLKAEMFARVDLNLMTEREALLVPREALVYRNAQPGVFVVESDTAMFRTVTPGVTEETRIEVVAGLTGDDVVVGRGANLLKSGDAVRVASAEKEAQR